MVWSAVLIGVGVVAAVVAPVLLGVLVGKLLKRRSEETWVYNPLTGAYVRRR